MKGESERIAATLAEQAAAWTGLGAGAGDLPLAELTSQAVAGLQDEFDPVNGGFGGAPKFPPSMVLEFLLRHYARAGSAEALSMAGQTCEAMARGGMYDQLGGGFARYSVDATWTVPHFEKMLYDNALLARVYTHLWRRTGSALARRVAEETCEFMLRDLRTAEGGFAASLDADSDGEEGAYYVWTPAELRVVLGDEDAAFAAEVFGVTQAGTFEDGKSVLAAPRGAVRSGTVRPDPRHAADGARRADPAGPGRQGGRRVERHGHRRAGRSRGALQPPRPRQRRARRGVAARLAARAPGEPPREGGARIVRTSRDGVAGTSAGLLEDYASVAAALLVLYGVTGEDRWVPVAAALLETVLTSFGDGSGGFYDTADDGERLIFRPADPTDGPTPSGAFAAADALLSYAALTGFERHRDAAVAALRVLAPIAARAPRFAGSGLSVAEALLSGPAEIAIVGPGDDPRTADLLRAALHARAAGAVMATGPGSPARRGRCAGPAAGRPGLV